MELDDAAPGDRVRRERVARHLRPVEHDHLVAHAGKQQGESASAGSGADDRDVVVTLLGVAHLTVSHRPAGPRFYDQDSDGAGHHVLGDDVVKF
jgi:hypothetical protein